MEDDLMYKAIAELLQVDEEVIDLLEPYIGEETGSSKEEWHYGYYAEIPSFEKLELEQQNYIRELLGDKFSSFPFGETEYFTDGVLSGTSADPLGWRYDFEYESIPTNEIVNELKLIKDKIKFYQDELILKALLFGAFSLTESYIRGFVKDIIPRYDNVNLPTSLVDLMDGVFRDKLNKDGGRKQLAKTFTDFKLDDIPEWDLRHKLAHNIGDMAINGLDITGEVKGVPYSKNIIDIIEELINYVSKYRLNL